MAELIESSVSIIKLAILSFIFKVQQWNSHILACSYIDLILKLSHVLHKCVHTCVCVCVCVYERERA